MSNPIETLRRRLSRHLLAINVAARQSPYRRFVLGLNMETCRRRNWHDLAANNVIHDYDANGALRLRFPGGWLSAAGNEAVLQRDLEDIAFMGVSAIRVFVFEKFEGLDFNFTAALTSSRQDADNGANVSLHSRVLPGTTVHVCTRQEFETLKIMWNMRLEVSPSNNATFQELLRNAETLQRLAGRVGLRVLWTLWTQYGEAEVDIPEHQHHPDDYHPWEYLIYYFGDRTNPAEPRKTDPVVDWQTFYNLPLKGGQQSGRLPIEAWIYRDLMIDSGFRDSYIENAVKPFVRHMERRPTRDYGEALGYEITNEADIVWEDCGHSWTTGIKGDGIRRVFKLATQQGQLVWDTVNSRLTLGAPVDLTTGWKLSDVQIRTFVQACAEAISEVFGEPGGIEKLLFSGVLGSQDDQTEDEWSLISPLRGLLSGGAMTRYAASSGWVTWNGAVGNGVHEVGGAELWMPSPCIFMEAGDYEDDCILHSASVAALLHRTINSRYAGVFVWHLDDPERSGSTYTDGTELTEPAGASGIHASLGGHGIPLPHSTGRPAVSQLQSFVRTYGRLLLPRIPAGHRPPP